MRENHEPIPFIEDDYNARFVRFFGWWVREKMLAKKFHAVHVERENAGVLRSLDGHRGPVLVLTNHVGWWDPLVMLTMHVREMPGRTLRAPMDAVQLERFKLFRKVGCFGIDPDAPASLPRMAEYVQRYFREDAGPTLWVTPQGRFADVREEIRIRPGSAAIAAKSENIAVVCMNFEYAFLVDQKPEVFIRFELVPTPEKTTTTGWHRAMLGALARNGSALAELVIARDPTPFEQILGGRSETNFFYDLWLKLRGRDGKIDDRRDRLQAREARTAGERA